MHNGTLINLFGSRKIHCNTTIHCSLVIPRWLHAMNMPYVKFVIRNLTYSIYFKLVKDSGCLL